MKKLLIALLFLLPTPALADHWGHGGAWGHMGWHGGGWGGEWGGNAAAGGFLGGLAGTVLGNIFAPPPVVVTPPPVIVAPSVPEIQPGSGAWYAYCANKYRTFNAQTGTYIGFDGQAHACQ